MTLRSRRPGHSRPGRSLFLGFILAAYGAIFMAPPLVSALDTTARSRQAGSGKWAPDAASAASASAGSSSAPAIESPRPSFDDCDRNGDGVLDKSEVARVPGLSAIFERADTNKDGTLDREEFSRALVLLGREPK
ncbi:MAG: EF-hand domain-containing protein [Betaproteobacteria bacterium]|nr:EF-hand domain-containing protein [Betaproteobacteria bacterium]